jgi:hypothetical protein
MQGKDWGRALRSRIPTDALCPDRDQNNIKDV